MLTLFNTLTRKKEVFKPLSPNQVGFYSCGPTVYDYAHIGHARTFIFADILQRTLEYSGYKVNRVMNITDVGHLTSDADSGQDKMEKGAAREHKSVWEVAEFYTRDFMQMCSALNIKTPDVICKATDNIPEMIEIIKTLEEKGFTYRIADGVYFDTTRFQDYGRLTGQTFDRLTSSLKAGARVEMAVGKKNPTDFALWKLSYPNGRSFDSAQDDVEKRRQMEWDSPWGRGFPGWHIECSAMSLKYLTAAFEGNIFYSERSRTIDIHTGGVDHIPIHHTNEIAQSEAATGKRFVNCWLHSDHLLVDGQKMSKSLGNFYRLTDLNEKGFSPMSLRYLFFTAHYRQQMNFTFKALEGAQNAYQSLSEKVAALKEDADLLGSVAVKVSDKNAYKYREKFKSAIENDLNIAQALAEIWEVLKSSLRAEDKLSLIYDFDRILGFNFKGIKPAKIKPGKDVEKLLLQRDKLRKRKKFAEADEIRKVIEDKGYEVKDTPEGILLKPKT